MAFVYTVYYELDTNIWHLENRTSNIGYIKNIYILSNANGYFVLFVENRTNILS